MKLFLTALCASFMAAPLSFAGVAKELKKEVVSACGKDCDCGKCKEGKCGDKCCKKSEDKLAECDKCKKKDGDEEKKAEGTLAADCDKCKKKDGDEEKKAEGTLAKEDDKDDDKDKEKKEEKLA